ncbi:TPA: hypothetical protein ACX3IQ_004021 [Vibrio parahaemolyticus]|uniref:hypothetical protein n=1 Tax=Vibrio TaxID=662 RepID=UPI00148C1BC6|nr:MULTISPECIES: hypothetical protein [Vibrio]ELB2819428.1 hypothetical protein [Vibrio alginolyticus]MBS9994683.1 hypothetical protein [Vibrio alginolyticus]MDW1537214.1 hypothetical protein [Vibrio sp. Y159]MDW1755384.1 hypothetical protein [Vibrio sp. Vb2535]MDW1801918.1 hypothetical protein [Vibrio sp. Vb2201]
MNNEQTTSPIDQVIFDLFTSRWVGASITKDLQAMRKELYKNLSDQVNGYWSGRTAYSIMVDGGFLVDGPSENKVPKRLTEFGKLFMKQYEQELEKVAQ